MEVLPALDRIVCFHSTVVPHEVRPCAAPRVAVTFWFSDYDEYLAAASMAEVSAGLQGDLDDLESTLNALEAVAARRTEEVR